MLGQLGLLGIRLAFCGGWGMDEAKVREHARQRREKAAREALEAEIAREKRREYERMRQRREQERNAAYLEGEDESSDTETETETESVSGTASGGGEEEEEGVELGELSVEGVARWLEGVGVGPDVVAQFVDQDVDGHVLTTLEEHDLRDDLGIKFGPRRKIIKALAAAAGPGGGRAWSPMAVEGPLFVPVGGLGSSGSSSLPSSPYNGGEQYGDNYGSPAGVSSVGSLGGLLSGHPGGSPGAGGSPGGERGNAGSPLLRSPSLLRIKLEFGGGGSGPDGESKDETTRVYALALPRDISFGELEGAVMALVGNVGPPSGSGCEHQVTLRYRDGDGDILELGSQSDWDAALAWVEHALLTGRVITLRILVGLELVRGQTPVPSPSLSASSSSSSLPLSPAGSGEVPDFTLGRKIGEGAFGKVYLAQSPTTGALMAVKQVEIEELDGLTSKMQAQMEKQIAAIDREVEILAHIGEHPNIVRYLGVVREGHVLSVVMEYVSGGSLVALMNSMGGMFPEPVAAGYIRQALLGLQYLHSREVIHRDVKGANILISAETQVVKLTDFGTSRVLSGLQSTSSSLVGARTFTGTPYFMAPEAVKQQLYGAPADIWSLGATAVEVVTGNPPWHKLGPVQAVFAIGRLTSSPPFTPPEGGLSDACAAFIGMCFEVDPKSRATVDELLSSDWLQQ